MRATLARRPLLAAALLGWALAVQPLATGVAVAVQPDEMLKDPALEARARAISSELRCLVCQNQSIDDSDAPLAKDLRILVRERLTAGDDDAAVKNWLVARYGEFVLLRPRFEMRTAILWLAPFAVLLLGGVAAWRTLRRKGARASVEAPLTEAEKARLADLLDR
ncbi:cytochrome c-type biogenesis protein [Pinisolibacter aquiterrae]|uniref:cytochrome c-type biogenesis protein n=1 Tax=Pinisolibacter aquiterrae TaxID=2815579 RepID=UPI001C3D1B6F|nr:cytochrome c-type biogenesis protein [Pinisolibacter aquiterrae]MBV5263150.1 cytochrome c-type biogenesis protein CcmH [Pinisolibacter aquiterrae]MCC8234064.1 cytochrome c-type biogenesis protein CcmH [Pinisolibacter aquiterrae]